ncbi:MAG: hypothetical protein C5S49_01785 [Candidatus Methanogaster sp.]|nr:MAG: hypothetical protein C5S49_01785 [ANME-2 cluster archaeon]
MNKINLTSVSLIVFATLVCASGVAGVASAGVTDPSDFWTSEDIVQLDATVSDGMLTVQVTERNSLDELPFHFIEIFLDTDQNSSTGDARVGGVGGVDYRISCITGIPGIIDTSELYRLPVEDGGDAQVTMLSDVPGASASVSGNVLSVSLPAGVIGGTAAVDVFAVAHKGGNPYSIIGNGDRCPEAGTLDTSTGEVIVRRPGVSLDVTFNDPVGDCRNNGQDITAARFRTFGDQFQIILTFADPVDPLDLSYELSGTVTMDSDRSLLTGFEGIGDAIPTWGGDADLSFHVCQLAPIFSLAFGSGSGSLLLFGPPNSDGRWMVQGNQLIMTASLSVFDARALFTLGWEGEVKRMPADGRTIATIGTFDYLLIADNIPEWGCALDTDSGAVLAPMVWDADATITETDPEEFGGISGMDLTIVGAEVIRNHLVVKGTLSKWGETQFGNVFEILLDTDMNSATGELVSNDLTSGRPAIGADYSIRVYSTDEYGYVEYHADLVRPDGVMEPHDAMLFAQPSSAGPASFTVAIPLEAIGDPAPELRLFVTTGAVFAGRYDIAPPNPMTVTFAGNMQPVAVFSHSPDNPAVGGTITFDASLSYDPDGYLVNYEWDFGEGGAVSRMWEIANHSYAVAGDYEVGLSVTDDKGATNTASATITVLPVDVPGDLNGDGQVTAADAAIALRFAARGEWHADADVSGDGRVTSLDALMILQAAGGRRQPMERGGTIEDNG